MNAIYGLYPDPAAVQRAVGSLQRAGIAGNAIEVVSSEPFEEFEFGRSDARSRMSWLVALGGVAGALCGYGFVAYTQRAFPIPTGGMAIVPLWTDGIIMYELTMLGAILTTAVTLVVSAGLFRWRKQLYDEAVSEGQILVGILKPAESSLPTLEKLLFESGAAAVKTVL